MWSQQQLANEALYVVSELHQLPLILNHSEIEDRLGPASINLLLLLLVHGQPEVVHHVLRVDDGPSRRLGNVVVDLAVGSWSLVSLLY